MARLSLDNPVLTKEMRVRMRGARAYWILTFYLLLLSLAMVAMYQAWASATAARGVGQSQVSQVGESMFGALIAAQTFLVLFITPAITSSSITVEKEQRTLEMLTVTRIPRRSIVVGKLLAAISFTALLIFASLPLVSLCFLFGSVDPAMIAAAFQSLLAVTFVVAALGLVWSTIAKSTTAAVMWTYASMFVGVIGSWVLLAVIAFSSGNPGTQGGQIGAAALAACGYALVGEKYMGHDVLPGTGIVICLLFVGWLLSVMAIARLDTWPERRAPLLRVLTLATVLSLLIPTYRQWVEAVFVPNAATMPMTFGALSPDGVLVLALICILLITPIFATGELLRSDLSNLPRYLAWGWTGQGLSRARVASGVPFLLLTAVLCYISFLVVFRVESGGKPVPATPTIGQTQWVTGVGANVGGRKVFIKNGSAAISTVTPAGNPAWAVPAVIIAPILGFAMVCVALSVLVGNRWVAMTLAYLFMVLLWIVPGIAQAGLSSGQVPGPSINAIYLNPTYAFASLTTDAQIDPRVSADRPFAQPLWLVCTKGWLLIGAGATLFAMLVARRRKVGDYDVPLEPIFANSGGAAK